MKRFMALEKLSRLHEGYRKAFIVEGRNLLLFQHDGHIHLILNECPHAGARLDRATLRGNAIVCPWHGMAFDLGSGHAASCGLTLVKYPVAYHAQDVGIYLE